MRRANDIPASLINLRIGVAQQFGGQRSSILEEACISEELLSNPTNRISVESTMKVWQAIVNQTGRHDIGLISGSRMRLASLGILGYLMMNSTTVGKAYEKLCVHQRLVASIAFMSIQHQKNSVRIIANMQEEWTPNFRYTIDFMIAATASIFTDNTHKEIRPLEVGFSFSNPEDTPTTKHFLGLEKCYSIVMKPNNLFRSRSRKTNHRCKQRFV